MTVRPDPKRPGSFIIDCRPDGYKGKRLRQSFDGTYEEARKWELALMRRHIEVRDPAVITCLAIYRHWIVYYRTNRAASTAADAETCWKHLQPAFGKLRPKHITRDLIERYKMERKAAGVAPRTVNKELSYLSSMITWATENHFCERLPFVIRGFPAKMTKAPEPRPLTPEQVTRIYEAIEPRYRLAFLLMADAGLRRSEALHLRREHVEFEAGLIYVRGKGNKERLVPITTDRLLAELVARKDTTGWLTVNQNTGKPYLAIRKALVRAAEKAGLAKHVYHHLLRHSFGTNATVAGFELSALQRAMGHSDPETTARYQHLAGEYLKAQGRKMQALVHRSRPDGRQDGADNLKE